jgi:hypothetical protein
MLLTFWRSQAPFRVSIALNLKGPTPRGHRHQSRIAATSSRPEHRAQNPSLVVPTSYNGNAKLMHLATLWFGQSAPGRQILQARMLAR